MNVSSPKFSKPIKLVTKHKRNKSLDIKLSKKFKSKEKQANDNFEGYSIDPKFNKQIEPEQKDSLIQIQSMGIDQYVTQHGVVEQYNKQSNKTGQSDNKKYEAVDQNTKYRRFNEVPEIKLSNPCKYLKTLDQRKPQLKKQNHLVQQKPHFKINSFDNKYQHQNQDEKLIRFKTQQNQPDCMMQVQKNLNTSMGHFFTQTNYNNYNKYASSNIKCFHPCPSKLCTCSDKIDNDSIGNQTKDIIKTQQYQPKYQVHNKYFSQTHNKKNNIFLNFNFHKDISATNKKYFSQQRSILKQHHQTKARLYQNNISGQNISIKRNMNMNQNMKQQDINSQSYSLHSQQSVRHRKHHLINYNLQYLRKKFHNFHVQKNFKKHQHYKNNHTTPSNKLQDINKQENVRTIHIQLRPHGPHESITQNLKYDTHSTVKQMTQYLHKIRSTKNNQQWNKSIRQAFFKARARRDIKEPNFMSKNKVRCRQIYQLLQDNQKLSKRTLFNNNNNSHNRGT